MKLRLFIFIQLLGLLFYNSCTIQKRKHLNGYHIEWLSQKSEKTPLNKIQNEENLNLPSENLSLENVEASSNKTIILIDKNKPNLVSSENKPVVNSNDYKSTKKNYSKPTIVLNKKNEPIKNNLNSPSDKSKDKQELWSILALAFGVCSLIVFPLFAIPGLIFAKKVTDPDYTDMAKIGKILSIIGLIIAILALLLFILLLSVFASF